MEIHNNTNPRLDDLLREARNEKPVMNLEEAEKIISSGNYTPAATPRGAMIGMNNLIVVSGIIVSSFLAFMVLKVDNQDAYQKFNVRHDVTARTSSVSKTQPSDELKNSEMQNDVQPNAEPEKNLNVVSLATPSSNDKPSNHLLASNAKVISTPAYDVVVKSEEAIATMKPTDATALPVEAAAKPTMKLTPNSELDVNFDSDEGEKVHVVFRRNEVSELTINRQKISSDNYNKYQDLIEYGRNILAGKSGEETVSADYASSTQLINFFDKELRSDKILTNEVNYIFELSSSKLLISGKEQTKDVFKKYLHLYEVKTGNEIVETSVYKFEKGAK